MELRNVVADLDAAMKKFRGEAAHKVADIVLYSLAIEGREQAGAVLAICGTPFARAALANTRATLDAALDAFYLVADEAEYDARAARSRVFELFEMERLQQRANIVGTAIPGASIDIEKAVTEDAKAADEGATGHGQLIRGAWEHYSKNPPKPNDHFSGLTRYELYRHLTGSGSEADEVVHALDIMYSMLSIGGSHARARASQRSIEIVGEDTLRFGSISEAKQQAERITSMALKFLIGALDRRRQFTSQAT